MKEGKFKKALTAIKDFYLSHKYVWLLLLWFVYVIWYGILNRMPSHMFHVMHMPIDDKIPLVEGFVLFYILWYVYIAAAFLYPLFTSKKDFLTMISLIFIGIITSLIICTVYPTKITFRPTDVEPDTFLRWIISVVYGTDNPVNVFPSIHCVVTIVITAGFLFSEKLRSKKPSIIIIKIMLCILTVGICASTVFVRQHSFADVLMGIAVSILTCLLTYFVIVPRFIDKKKVAAAPEAATADELPSAEETPADSEEKEA